MHFFYGNNIDSKIIKSQKELDLIKNTLKNIYKKDTNFKLLFRAKDGETVSSFHKHCDGIPNLLRDILLEVMMRQLGILHRDIKEEIIHFYSVLIE